jgi:hypothetical protein
MVASHGIMREEEWARAARPGTGGAREVLPAADVSGAQYVSPAEGYGTPCSGSHPGCLRSCPGTYTGSVRPHRISPAMTAFPEIGAPGWNDLRSHGRQWTARERSTMTGRSSFGLGLRCRAYFARLRGYTQM